MKKGIKDEDFLAKAESDRRDGLSITADQYEGEFQSFKLSAKKDKREQADKRKEVKKEEERLATNMRSEETLGKVLGTLMFSQKAGATAAKKAMQMKESVHKWWEDKKEKIASGAKSILSWLMKAAGIGLLWLLFKYLAGLDWKKLWEDAQGWGEVMKSFWSGIVSMGAWVGALKFGPWVKGLFGPKGSLFNFGQKMKSLWDGFKKLKFVKMITDITKSFKGHIVKAITGVFTKLKATKFIGPLFEGIGKLFKAGGKIFKLFGGGAKLVTVGPWEKIIKIIKGVFNAVTGPFKKGGSVGGVIDDIIKFVTKIPGLGKIMGFVGKAAKLFAKLFAPITLVWGIVESIFAGWDAAEKEKGGLGAKIMAFMSGALKKLLDFFVFDLANMVQDGIKWAIKWVMGLFGFSEEEQKAATDWDLVGAVRDAIFKAIDWIKGLFAFGGKPDGTGFSFKGLAPLVDILLFPLNAVFKWLGSVFGWDTDKDGKKKKDFSLGTVLMDALDAVFKWIADLFKIDFGALAKNIMPEALYNFLFGKGSKAKQELNKMGLIDEDLIGKDDLELDKIKEAIINQKKKGGNIAGLMNALTNIAQDESIDAGDRKKLVKMLKAEGANLATGGLFSGGMALVGESGPEIMVSTIPARVIPAKQTADLMSGVGGGQNFAPTTIVNSSPTSSSTIIASSSLNPISQKYFRN
ncbi:MAG TPA: hypothetical protein EYP94_03230 [Gammaproteobacteria bacterium]|nr:hypothetical protein [Gammaproteobacteria bacterium]